MLRALTLRLVILLPLLAGCSLITEPSVRLVSFQFRTLTALEQRTEITYEFSVKNHGWLPAFLPACGDRTRPTLRLELPDGTLDAFSLVCPANYPMAPVRLEPGSTLTDTAKVQRLVGTRYTPIISYTHGLRGKREEVSAPSFVVPAQRKILDR